MARSRSPWQTIGSLFAAALAAALLLGVGAQRSGAAVTPSADPAAIADTMIASGVSSTAAVFEAGTPPPLKPVASDENGYSDHPIDGFPTDGNSFAILTNGNVDGADRANLEPYYGFDGQGTPPAGRGTQAFDVTTLRVDVEVPPADNCLSLDYRFLSEEFPEYVGGQYNDAFIVELDNSTWTTEPGGAIVAPDDFATATGQPVSVNGVGPADVSPAEAAGTTYDAATAIVTTQTPVTPGSHSVYLSLFDVGDHVYDSAVFLDALRLSHETTGICQPPGQPPAPPTFTATDPSSPANDNSPKVIGDAEPGSDIDLYTTSDCSGDPAASGSAADFGSPGLPVPVDDNSFTTFYATATNEYGSSECSSGSITYVEETPGPAPPSPSPPADTQQQSTPTGPQPVFTKSVVAGSVEGTIKVKLPGSSSFTELDGNAQIPVGTTVDATAGTVKITSAIGGGTQSADFHGSKFLVKQKREGDGLTDLVLKGGNFPRTCGIKPAFAGSVGKQAAITRGKGVRGLWGNGKGRFRTRGRHSAATVRGTHWFTQDRCDGTLTYVKHGVVDVHDFTKRKHVTVKTGGHYLARAG